MNTAKEALLAAGRIKEIGRGRISNDNHTWLLAQCAKGITYSDYPKKGAKVVTLEATPDAPEQTVYVKPTEAPSGKVIAEIHCRYPDEKNWKVVPTTAKTLYGATEFGMREVCNCGNSLTYCFCDKPVIHVDIPVEVVRRK